MQNIDKILSFEIKQEISSRYFGFRKMIEEDIINYSNLIDRAVNQIKENIGSDLARLKVLLGYSEITLLFLKTTGLEKIEKIICRPEFSVDLKKVGFTHIQSRGITRKARFRNMLFSIYDELSINIKSYIKLRQQIDEEHQVIIEEIKLFHEKNDLTIMMDFLRNLDEPGSYKTAAMEGTLAQKTGETLDKKMRITPPLPAGKTLPPLPRPHPVREIRRELKQIADTAWKRRGKPEARTITERPPSDQITSR